jgi:tetratricopeptide (TPR) repeat protein
MTPRSTLALAALLAAGCTSVPPDPYAAAAHAADGGDLFAALQWLDRVPMAHGRYPESRVLAAAIERRIRSSHELLVAGMAMRSQHRDDEAIRCFEQALQIWPGLRGAGELRHATQLRCENLARAPSPVLADPVVAITQPVTEPGGGHGQDDPAPAAAPLVEPAPAAEAAPGEPERAARGAAAVAEEVARAERALERGEIEAALAGLTALARLAPKDPEVVRVLARILRQRALLRYGQGQLEEAITDWDRVLELDRDDEPSRRFREAARVELAARVRR